MKSTLKLGLRKAFHACLGVIPPADRAAVSQYLQGGLIQAQHRLLSMAYQERVRAGHPLPSFQDAAFQQLSQNGEDGILLMLFAVLGTRSRIAVEMCVESGIECNSANLVVNHGWSALLFDGDERKLAVGRKFYSRVAGVRTCPPRLVRAWITAENANTLIEENGIRGEVDLLSLDLDGVDYWIWNAIAVIQPRVVVLEYNNLWKAEDAVTVPYRAEFAAEFGPDGPEYAGASLAAFQKLGLAKGYRLVGIDPSGVNAFFLRNSEGLQWFPEVSVSECLTHPFAVRSHKERWPRIKDKAWQRV